MRSDRALLARFIYVACNNNRWRGCRANFKNELSDKTILVIGIVFIVTGVSLWVFTGLNILTREQTLIDTNLSVEERARIGGSLRWWRDLSARLSYPLAAVLLIGGLTIMLTTRARHKSCKD
jgi:hypothetical protein